MVLFFMKKEVRILKTIKYGKYKVYVKIKNKILKEIFEFIRKNTTCTNMGEGNVEFTLNNLERLVDYELNTITNINKKNDYKYTQKELRKLKDNDLDLCFKLLDSINRSIFENYKDMIISKVEVIGNKRKEINL